MKSWGSDEENSDEESANVNDESTTLTESRVSSQSAQETAVTSSINITPPPSGYLDSSPDKSPDIDPKTKEAIRKLKDALKKSKEVAAASNNNTTTMSECDISHIPAATPITMSECDLSHIPADPAATPGSNHHQMTFSAKSTISNSTPKNLEKALPTEGKQPCPKCGNLFKKVSSHIRWCKKK